jgi:8-oxo-dGTP pyrophosphatase MutT (NUDIX family)
MSKKKRVRPLAICVFRHYDRILVMEGYDALKKEHFYRPLGGGIEFGEPGTETICRELMEEINVEVDRQSLKYLGTLENIFTFDGKPGHEIIMIYDGALRDSGLYERPVIVGQEVDGEEFRASWKNISEFGVGKSILYPTGLLEMLQGTSRDRR